MIITGRGGGWMGRGGGAIPTHIAITRCILRTWCTSLQVAPSHAKRLPFTIALHRLHRAKPFTIARALLLRNQSVQCFNSLLRPRIASLSHPPLPWGPALEATGRYRARRLFRVCAGWIRTAFRVSTHIPCFTPGFHCERAPKNIRGITPPVRFCLLQCNVCDERLTTRHKRCTTAFRSGSGVNCNLHIFGAHSQ
jgi:hypothetical protein